MQPSDQAMVYIDWLRSYQPSLDVRGTGPTEYRDGMGRRILRLLAASQTAIAVHASYPTAALGWCCFAGDAVHFVYVKSEARRKGIAHELLASIGEPRRYSHRTYMLKKIKNLRGLVFDPFAMEA